MSTNITNLTLGEMQVTVTHKDIKGVHLTVHPPDGEVRVSAPLHVELDRVRVFIISKLRWIKKQQQQILSQEREPPREYLNQESHYFQGKRYLLRLIEHSAPAKVELTHNYLELYTRPGLSLEKRHHLVSEWYRQQLKETIPPLIAKYEPVMGVEVREFGVKRMKTRWGTCNPKAQRIWLNLELAKKPLPCLEYVIVHEMAHLLEPKHNDNFWRLLDQFYPQWEHYRDELNRLPLS